MLKRKFPVILILLVLALWIGLFWLINIAHVR